MNKVYLIGEIIEMSDYKFFYNSKNHNSIITIKIKVFDSNYQKGIIIELIAYDEMADKVYRTFENGDMVSIEGRFIKNMQIEILDIYYAIF